MNLNTARLTPAMRQYKQAKDEHPDCIILLRMGDFYELFYDDAILGSKVLGITLTSRGKGESKAPLAGIPYHALDSYLGKLVKAGYKVALCEQLEDPKKAKGLVKRGVVRVVTPGTIYEDNLLEKNVNNFIVTVSYEFGRYGLAFCDISTGEFQTTELPDEQHVVNELHRLSPTEIVLPDVFSCPLIMQYAKLHGVFVSRIGPAYFLLPRATAVLKKHFDVLTLDGFGFSKHPVSVLASGALLAHIHQQQRQQLHHITAIKQYNRTEYMNLDAASIRNLELVKNIRDGAKKNTLLDTIDVSVTPMGSRKLRRWLLRPLLDVNKIRERHDGVNYLMQDVTRLRTLASWLKNTSDLYRVTGRLSHGRGNARDLVAVKDTLLLFQNMQETLADAPSVLGLKTDALTTLAEHIHQMIVDEPPAQTKEGGMIRTGIDEELDATRSLRDDAARFIRDMEERERQRTSIPNLKIKYNRVFGYFIEVTARHLDKVPTDYMRKQTIANGERYFLPELKELEQKILSSEEKIVEREHALFTGVIVKVTQHTRELQAIAEALGTLDCLMSFAEAALRFQFVRPHFVDEGVLQLVGSRHPVVERSGKTFVPNDCLLDETTRMLLITGPNMAGKSTYLRQVAICVLLAQIGSFVPCTQATLRVVDRIFTRIGAYDDLSRGESTFMVEMAETANILHHATDRSLVILDEIGRGTSTYDGVSIAQAVFEHLHDVNQSKALFATHYHHLNYLQHSKPHVKNVHMKVQESNKNIVFLHSVVEGGTDKSYGVHVAKLAGLPQQVIERSREIMKRIEALDVLEESIQVPKKKIQPSLAAFIDEHPETR